MKVLLFDVCKKNTDIPNVLFKEITNKEDEIYPKTRYAKEVIDYIENIPISESLSSEMVKIVNGEINFFRYISKNNEELFVYRAGITPIIMRVVNVDTARPWIILKNNNSEQIKYLDELPFFDESCNLRNLYG